MFVNNLSRVGPTDLRGNLRERAAVAGKRYKDRNVCAGNKSKRMQRGRPVFELLSNVLQNYILIKNGSHRVKEVSNL